MPSKQLVAGSSPAGRTAKPPGREGNLPEIEACGAELGPSRTLLASAARRLSSDHLAADATAGQYGTARMRERH